MDLPLRGLFRYKKEYVAPSGWVIDCGKSITDPDIVSKRNSKKSMMVSKTLVKALLEGVPKIKEFGTSKDCFYAIHEGSKGKEYKTLVKQVEGKIVVNHDCKTSKKGWCYHVPAVFAMIAKTLAKTGKFKCVEDLNIDPSDFKSVLRGSDTLYFIMREDFNLSNLSVDAISEIVVEREKILHTTIKKPKVEPKPIKEIKKPKRKLSEDELVLIPKPEIYYDPTGGFLTNVVRHAFIGRKNVLLFGPAGSGKDTLVRAIASELGIPMITIAGDSGVDKYDFLGMHLAKGGETVWVDGPLTTAMKRGYLLNISEVNYIKPDVLTVLNRPLAERILDLKEHGGHETIVAHPDFFIVASQNEGAEYIGTRQENFAFRTRFHITPLVDYLPPDLERKLIVEKTGIDEKVAKDMVEVAIDTRIKKDEGNLTAGISPRSLIEWAELVQAGFSIRESAEVAVVNQTGYDPQERKIISDLVDARF